VGRLSFLWARVWGDSPTLDYNTRSLRGAEQVVQKATTVALSGKMLSFKKSWFLDLLDNLGAPLQNLFPSLLLRRGRIKGVRSINNLKALSGMAVHILLKRIPSGISAIPLREVLNG